MNRSAHNCAVTLGLLVTIASSASSASAEQSASADQSASAAPPIGSPDQVGGWASDRLLVQLMPGASVSMTSDRVVAVLDCEGVLDAVATVELTIRSLGVTPLFTVPPANTALAKKLGLDRWVVVHLPLGTNVPALAKRISTSASTAIERAEADVIGAVASECSTPSDASFAQQWALENTGQTVGDIVGTPDADINARGAWHLSTGSATTIVAILDGGVNPHQQFADRLMPGINIPAGTTDTTDNCSNHGTMTAGVIAAAGNDAIGIAGIDWNTRILPVVVLDGCSGVTSWFAQGLTWATDQGANVINCSLQYNNSTTVMQNAVLYAHASGVAIVAASGNMGETGVTYPAKYVEVIGVGSLNAADAISSTSGVGQGVDVEAPGVDVLSTSGLNEYAISSGTSCTQWCRRFLAHNFECFSKQHATTLANQDPMAYLGWDVSMLAQRFGLLVRSTLGTLMEVERSAATTSRSCWERGGRAISIVQQILMMTVSSEVEILRSCFRDGDSCHDTQLQIVPVDLGCRTSLSLLGGDRFARYLLRSCFHGRSR